MASKYPSYDEIRALFSNLETDQFPKFFEKVSPDVDWTIMGTSPMSRRFTSLEEFQSSTLARLRKVLKQPLQFEVMNIIGGHGPWASVELRARPVECLNGLDYRMVYCWQVKFNEDGIIVQVRAYLDTELLKEALESNECISYRAPKDVY